MRILSCILVRSIWGCLCSLIVTVALHASPQPEAATASANLTLSLDHSQTILGQGLSPDESILYTWDRDHVRTWDLATGKRVHEFGPGYSAKTGSQPAIEAVRLALKRRWLLLSDSDRLQVFDLSQPAKPNYVREYSWVSHKFAYDEKRDRIYYFSSYAYAEGRRFELRLSDLDPGADPKKTTSRLLPLIQKKAADHPQHPIEVRQIEMLANGQLFISTWADGFVIVDPSAWKVIHHQPHPDEPNVNNPAFFAGPDSTVLVTWREGSFVRLQVLGGPDFSLLRETRLPLGMNHGELTYDQPTAYDAKRGIILLNFTNHAPEALDFATLRPLTSPRNKAAAPSPDTVIGGHSALYIPSRQEWLVALDHNLAVCDPATGRILRRLGVPGTAVQRLIASPNGRELLVAEADKRGVKRVRFYAGGVEVIDAPGLGGNALSYSPDGSRIISYGGRQNITLSSRAAFPAADRLLPAAFQSSFNAYDTFHSPDGRLIGIHGEWMLMVVNLEGTVVFRQDLGSWTESTPARERGAFSPDQRTIIAATPGPALTAYDLASGRQLWTQKVTHPHSHVFFASPDIFASFNGRQLEYRSVTDGQVMFTASLPGLVPGQLLATALSPDHKLFAAKDSIGLRLYDAETGDQLSFLPTGRSITALTFLADNRTLVSAGEDQLIRLLDTSTQKELATLALFHASTDWVLSTPDLRFDGAEAALGQLYLVKSGTVLPLESMFEKLYTPRLAAALFDADTPAPAPADINTLAFAPVAHIELIDGARNLTVDDDITAKTSSSSRARVRVNAVARQSQVAEIRLYQNGKLVQTTTRNLTVEDDEPMDDESTKTFELELTPGENLFRAVAINAQRTESAPAELAVTYAPGKADPGTIAGASGGGLRLHLLIVGINAYKNPRYRLNYAVADANATAARLREHAAGIFTDVRVTALIDGQADKAAITGALQAIAAEAKPRDVFVFYYAGHGVMSGEGGAKGDFFLVPYDVTQLYGADEQLASKALSSKELLEFSKSIPAQKQLFLLDACQSAGALQTVAMRGAAEEKAIAQLARSSGTHWITASGSEQFATEFDQLGHGAFTYALLDGLLGKGDNGDGRITVNELKAWLESQVPEITQKYKGTPQYPASYGYGQDFPVGIAKAN